jgi:uncharacterized SAM-binding protein YcdF (DUF218 family)
MSSLDADFAEYILLGFFALPLISSLICNIIFMLLSRKDDAHSLIGAALLVKLVHIPSYIFIFLLGVGASIMIFMTFALILMFILFDYMVLASSGMISVFALAKNIKNNKTTAKHHRFFKFCRFSENTRYNKPLVQHQTNPTYSFLFVSNSSRKFACNLDNPIFYTSLLYSQSAI